MKFKIICIYAISFYMSSKRKLSPYFIQGVNNIYMSLETFFHFVHTKIYYMKK